MPKSAFSVSRLSSLFIWMAPMEKHHYPNRYRISVYYCIFVTIFPKYSDIVDFLKKTKGKSFLLYAFFLQTDPSYAGVFNIIIKSHGKRRWGLAWGAKATCYPNVWNKGTARKNNSLLSGLVSLVYFLTSGVNSVVLPGNIFFLKHVYQWWS